MRYYDYVNFFRAVYLPKHRSPPADRFPLFWSRFCLPAIPPRLEPGQGDPCENFMQPFGLARSFFFFRATGTVREIAFTNSLQDRFFQKYSVQLALKIRKYLRKVLPSV